MTDHFSPDYATARRRFLGAAGRAGAEVRTIPAPVSGPAGEPLFVDIATVGPRDTPDVVVASSGLHGVEGFVGSAIQLAWMERAARPGRRLPSAVVLMHAVNPFGFAWIRRTNEHNVDLNRNFLAHATGPDDDAYRAALAVYERANAFLNPRSAPSRWEPYEAKALGLMVTVGLRNLTRALPVGQYAHASGLFYGGTVPEWSTTLLRSVAAAWAATARRVTHLDFHSGLGRWGARQLFIDPADGSHGERLGRHFGADIRPPDARLAYRAHGTMAADLRDRLAPCVYEVMTAEFGTYAGLRVLGALRAENRAHFHAPPGSPVYQWAKRRLRQAFVPDSPRWRRSVVASGVALIDRSLERDPI